MDALDDPACCIYDRFFRESLPYDHAYSPGRHSGVHTNGKEWTCSDIPTVGSLHAQIPSVYTLSVLFLPVLLYTFSRLLVLGVQLSVRTPVSARRRCPFFLHFDSIVLPSSLSIFTIDFSVRQFGYGGKLSLGGLSPIEYRQRLGCAVSLVQLSIRPQLKIMFTLDNLNPSNRPCLIA